MEFDCGISRIWKILSHGFGKKCVARIWKIGIGSSGGLGISRIWKGSRGAKRMWFDGRKLVVLYHEYGKQLTCFVVLDDKCVFFNF